MRKPEFRFSVFSKPSRELAERAACIPLTSEATNGSLVRLCKSGQSVSNVEHSSAESDAAIFAGPSKAFVTMTDYCLESAGRRIDFTLIEITARSQNRRRVF